MTHWTELVPPAPTFRLTQFIATSPPHIASLMQTKEKCLFSENIIKSKVTDHFKGQDFDYHTSSRQRLNLTIDVGLNKRPVLAHP